MRKVVWLIIIILVIGFSVWFTLQRRPAIKEEREVKKEERREESIKVVSEEVGEPPKLERDPFLPSDKTVVTKVQGLELTSIIWSPIHPRAIINGEIVEEGDSIDGKLVKRIEEDKVILMEGSRELTLPWEISKGR